MEVLLLAIPVCHLRSHYRMLLRIYSLYVQLDGVMRSRRACRCVHFSSLLVDEEAGLLYGVHTGASRVLHEALSQQSSLSILCSIVLLFVATNRQSK